MMNVIDQCRDIKQLNPLVQAMLELALADIKRQGVNPLVVETYRTQERQNYLYCQGRTLSECLVKGFSKDFAEKYCNPKAVQVTWTLSSVHTSRKAVDVVPQRLISGKMAAVWNTQDVQTKIIIQIMENYGFEAGANWSTNADSPHFQMKGEFDSLFMEGKNTPYITKAIQAILKKKINSHLKVDGIWGVKTTEAINMFRKIYKWCQNGKLGATALKKLFL